MILEGVNCICLVWKMAGLTVSVKSIEMIGGINRTRSKSIEVIDRTFKVNWTQSKIWFNFVISIVWSINSIVPLFDRSIQFFDCLIDQFNSSIDLTNQFDWVRLSLINSINNQIQLRSIDIPWIFTGEGVNKDNQGINLTCRSN